MSARLDGSEGATYPIHDCSAHDSHGEVHQHALGGTMAEGLNRVMLLGNLGADPDLRFGQGADQAVLRLHLATTESYFDKRTNERKERTDWHNVVLFGKRAEALQKILAKGSTIFV